MENYNRQQKLAFAICAIVGVVVFGFLMMLINGGFSYDNFKSVLVAALFLGLFMGIGFPYLLKILAPKLEKKVKSPTLQKNEHIIFEGRANLFQNWFASAGGKLFLTNERLIFSAHKYNFNKGETSIPLQEITQIKGRKTGKLVDNGLRIEIDDQSRFDFVINHRSQWLERLNNGIDYF